MENQTLLSPIMDAIIEQFKTQYGNTHFIGDYEDANQDVNLPAIYIQLGGLEGVENPIPEVFRASCLFVAFICESFRGEAKTRVRDMAFDVAHFVNGKFWGDINTFSKAKFELAEEDPFNEKIDSSEIWRVEWRQEIYLDSSTK